MPPTRFDDRAFFLPRGAFALPAQGHRMSLADRGRIHIAQGMPTRYDAVAGSECVAIGSAVRLCIAASKKRVPGQWNASRQSVAFTCPYQRAPHSALPSPEGEDDRVPLPPEIRLA